MSERSAEFSSFQDVHVRTDKRIDITISIRPMVIKFARQVHLQNLTQVRVIKHVMLI